MLAALKGSFFMLNNPNDLTAAQQIFAVFYAIFFGTMLQTIGARSSISNVKPMSDIGKMRKDASIPYASKLKNTSLNLFDTPNAQAIGVSCYNKPLWRFIASLIVLNIFPGWLFAIIFTDLHHVQDSLNVTQIVIIVWISLAPQYIYRLFYAGLTLLYKTFYLTGREPKKYQYSKYRDYDFGALIKLWEERLQFSSHAKVHNHIAAPLYFYVPVSIILYHYFLNPIYTCVDLIGLCLSFITAGILVFFF